MELPTLRDVFQKVNPQKRELNILTEPAGALASQNAYLMPLPMEPNQKTHSETNIDTLAKHLKDYRIALWVYDKTTNAVSEEPKIWNGGAQEGVISIILANKHFDYIKPTTELLVSGADTSREIIILIHSWCPKCDTFAQKGHARKNSRNCKRCGHDDCNAPRVPAEEVVCNECNIEFRNLECFTNHTNVSSAYATHTMCAKVTRCATCKAIHERGDVGKNRRHVCGATYFCRYCNKNVETLHECYHQPPNDKQKENKMKKQEEFKVVVYDIESRVDAPDTLHVPNVLCYAHFCEKCFKKPDTDVCSTCPPPKTLSYIDGKDPVAEFIDLLASGDLQRGYNDLYVVAHNGGRYDHGFLMEELYTRPAPKKHKVDMEFLRTGSTIIGATWKLKNAQEKKVRYIHFRDSYRYIPMALSRMPKAFGIQGCKGTFPYLFNTSENQRKTFPTHPDPECYAPDQMTPEGRAEFLKWYETQKQKPFDFNKEIVEYCRMDVQILKESLKTYISLCMELCKGWNPIVHAHTLAGYVLHVMKYEYIGENVLGVIPENGFPGRNNSLLALKMLLWFEHSEKLTLKHWLNGGEQLFVRASDGKQYYADGYDVANKTVCEINGCSFHGCPKCFDAPNRDKRFCNSSGNPTYAEQFARYEDKKRCLEEDHKLTVVTFWECDIKNKLRKNAKMRRFFKNCRHTHTLRPRHAMAGGRTQPFKAHAVADADWAIGYRDFCSLYPSVNLKTRYPKGQPMRIVSDFEEIVPGMTEQPYHGIIPCDVLPPTTREIPVLPYHQDKKLMFTLCRTCVEDGGNAKCTHAKVSERVLRLLEALENGDIIICYCDPDSVMYLYRRDTDHFKEMNSEGLGKLTNEVPDDEEIVEAVWMAPKAYALEIIEKADHTDIRYVVKCKGATMNNVTAKKINFYTMKAQVADTLKTYAKVLVTAKDGFIKICGDFQAAEKELL